MISLSYPLSSLLTNKKIGRFNFLGEREIGEGKRKIMRGGERE